MHITSSTPDLENQVQVRSIDLGKFYQEDNFKKHFLKYNIFSDVIYYHTNRKPTDMRERRKNEEKRNEMKTNGP